MFNKRIIITLCVLVFLILSTLSLAVPPLPFTAYYDARFQGLKAQAEISLTQLTHNEFLANSSISIRVFGVTISTIRENSYFEWYNDIPRPYYYEYLQSGIGGRNHSVHFDWQNNLAIATAQEESVELQLENSTLDELSMYALIKKELLKGAGEIKFAVIDRNIIKEYHYRIIAEEEVLTTSGTFSAIKVERIRESSDRITQLWFAKNHDMLLIKLYQRAPDGDEFEITLRNAQINGEIVTP